MKRKMFLVLVVFSPCFLFAQDWVTEMKGDSLFVEVEKGKPMMYVNTDLVNNVIIANSKKLFETQLALTEAAKEKARLEKSVNSIQASIARHEKLKAILLKHRKK